MAIRPTVARRALVALVSRMPARLRQALGRARMRWMARDFAGATVAERFGRIYAAAAWGRDAEGRASSGSGSHDAGVVEPYVAALRGFLAREAPVRVVDLGCGDFAVGARIADLAEDYLALDVVPELIAAHRERFAGLPVRFEVHDATAAPVPACDVVILRQVLQHLSNADIAAVLANIAGRCRFLVLTEHRSGAARLLPNRDVETGALTRHLLDSHVDVFAPPFSLVCRENRVLCTVPEPHVGGVVETRLIAF